MTMTNNPTIDGVLRDTILRALSAVMSNKTSHWSSTLADELRALLDADRTGDSGAMVAPAGERQEAKPYPDRLCHIDYSAHPYRCGCLRGDDEAQRIFDEHKISALQATIAQLEDKLSKAINLDFQRRETIARLEARVQELESGGGDPVARVEVMGGGAQLWLALKTQQLPIGVHNLFTSPPAQVAVVINEQQEFSNWTHEVVEFEHSDITRKIQRRDLMDVKDEKSAWDGWQARACLDATAALKGVKS